MRVILYCIKHISAWIFNLSSFKLLCALPIIFSIACFLPAFFGLDDNTTHPVAPLKTSIKSETYHYSLAIGVAVSLPIVLDYSLDAIFRFKSLWENPCIALSKGAAVASLLFPNLVMLIMFNEVDYQYIPATAMTRIMMVAVSFLLSISHYGQPVFNTINMTALMFVFCLGALSSSISAFKIPYLFLFFIIRYFAYISFSFAFIIYTYRWIKHLLRHESWSNVTFEEYCCNIHLISAWIIAIGYWTINRAYNVNWANSSDELLSALNYMQSFVTVVLLLSYARITRRETDIQQINNELETKRAFVRYVSHEIRTPLNTLVMGLKYLRKQLIKSGQHKDWEEIVEDLHGSCDTAVEILDNLLTYEKLTTNILVLDKLIVDAIMFLKSAIQPFFLQAREADIQLSIKYASKLLNSDKLTQLLIDKNKISQVIRNLLSNALKFSKQNSIVDVQVSIIEKEEICISPCKKPTVLLSTLFCKSPGHSSKFQTSTKTVNEENIMTTDCKPLVTVSYLKIEVIDHGPGISLENQQRLFKEIIQFNPGELQDGKGSGLGLWISHQIVKLHNGTLSVYSEGLGHGSTFTVELPIKERNISSNNIQTDSIPQYRNQRFVMAYNNEQSSSFRMKDIPTKQIQRSIRRVHASSNNYESNVAIGSETSKRSEICQLELESDGLTVQSFHVATESGKRSSFKNDWDEKMSDRMASISAYSRAFSISSREENDYIDNPEARVLIVDDASLSRKMMMRVLRHEWNDITQAEDGIQAVKAVQYAMKQNKVYDIILMDYQMPNMNGPNATKHIRDLGFNGKIIGVTGNALQADINMFLSHGANDVLIKPLQLDLLRTCIQDKNLKQFNI